MHSPAQACCRSCPSTTHPAVAPAAGNNIATAIENAYLAIEPWVYYGFELVVYAANYVIPFGLANQILYIYNLFEPMVQSGLFNILDWLSGSITFSQGLANFWAATTASINNFINTEINWFLSFFPPLPPLPPWWPFEAGLPERERRNSTHAGGTTPGHEQPQRRVFDRPAATQDDGVGRTARASAPRP